MYNFHTKIILIMLRPIQIDVIIFTVRAAEFGILYSLGLNVGCMKVVHSWNFLHISIPNGVATCIPNLVTTTIR